MPVVMAASDGKDVMYVMEARMSTLADAVAGMRMVAELQAEVDPEKAKLEFCEKHPMEQLICDGKQHFTRIDGAVGDVCRYARRGPGQ